MAGAPKGKSRSASSSRAPSLETFLLLILGTTLITVSFLQFEAFRWIGVPFSLPANHLNFLIFLGAVLLFLGFRGLPESPNRSDVPRWVVYPLLALFLGLTLFMRLYRGNAAMGRYWDDPAICIIDPCNIMELHMFRLTFAIGHREPLYPYAAAGLWSLFPSMSALLAQRLTSALFDTAAGWFFYRLGREVTGKRLAGLFLAALGAFSKPEIMQNLGGMPGLTLPFIVGLILWTQFRLFRKPDLPHFLQWGFILGAGFYSYIAYRPWMLFLALTTLGWLLWKERARSVRWPLRLLLIVGVGGLFLFLLDRLFVIFLDNPISKIWRANLPVWLLIQVILFGTLGYYHRVTQGKERVLAAWGLGVLLAGFLAYPLAMNEEIGIKIRDLSIIPKDPSHWVGSNFIHTVWERASNSVRDLFYTGDDRSDMNVEGDPFFDLQAAVLALFGLVWAVSRFSWTRIFLLACVGVGMVGRILTIDPTSAKLLGSLPAMLLLAAWGLEEWSTRFLSASGIRRWAGVLLLLGFTGFWLWEGQTTFTRVYDKWWHMFRPDILVSDEITAQLPTKRVYMAEYHGMGFASPATESVIHDGKSVYLLAKQNVIDVLPGEERRNVSVMVAGMDKEWGPLLKKEFPKAQWIPKWEYYQAPSDLPLLYDVVIPASQIPERPGKLFQYHVVPEKKWLRRVYVTYFGLGRGMILYEDSSPTLNPLPPGLGAHSASAEGDWTAPADGDYEFSVRSPNPIQLWVDGKKVLTSVFSEWTNPSNVSKTIHLTRGPHHVRYLSFLRVNAWFEQVNIRNPEAGVNQVLGQ
ncbi:MAG TPA: PA14 domain-containing protein [bacterium]|nr:PA14 domain-containing protein [bacterium]